jgi:hypothetical protein
MSKELHVRTGTALSLERLEERTVLTAGSVDVSFAGGALTLTGDANSDNIVVTQTKSGAMEIIGLGKTTLTSSDNSVTISKNTVVLASAPTSISDNLGTGNSSVSFAHVTLPATVSVTGADGSDLVNFVGVKGGSAVSVSLGNGHDGVNVGASSLGSLSVSLGSNNDEVGVAATSVTGTTSITTAGGNSHIVLGGPFFLGDKFGGDVSVTTGAGNDNVVAFGTFAGNLTLDGGGGNNSVFGSVKVTGTLTVNNVQNNHLHS